MKVSELIEHLKTLDQDMLVAYAKYSEQCLLDLAAIEIKELCKPRIDGWVQSKRPDMPTQTYVLIGW